MNDFRFAKVENIVPSGASRIYRNKDGMHALVIAEDFTIYLRSQLSNNKIKQEKLFEFKSNFHAAENVFTAFGVAVEKFGNRGLEAVKLHSFDIDHARSDSIVYLRISKDVFRLSSALSGFEEIELNPLRREGAVQRWREMLANSSRKFTELETINNKINANQRAFGLKSRSVTRRITNEYALGD